ALRLQASQKPLHRGRKTLLADRLDKIIQRFSLKSLNRKLIERRQKHNCRHAFDASLLDNFKSINARHLNVEKHYIRRRRVKRSKHFSAVATLSGNGKLGKARQQLPHAATRGRLIVGN